MTNLGASWVLLRSVQKAVLEVTSRSVLETAGASASVEGDVAVRHPVLRAGANTVAESVQDFVGFQAWPRPLRSRVIDPGHPRLDKFLKECGG
jgi:hypothetical protein